MAQFIFTYEGGMPADRAAAAASLKRWKDWFDSLGTALVDKGSPAKVPTNLHPAGQQEFARAASFSGYTIISAPDTEGALEVAQKCPVHAEGGRLGISRALSV